MSMTAEETTNFVEEAHLQDVCRLVARRSSLLLLLLLPVACFCSSKDSLGLYTMLPCGP